MIRMMRKTTLAKELWVIIALAVADVFALITALYLAFIFRLAALSYSHIIAMYWAPNTTPLLIALAFFIMLFAVFHLYRHAWRFASLETVWGILAANTCGAVVMVLLLRAFHGPNFPRLVFVLFWILSNLIVGALRVALRTLNLCVAHRRRLLAAFGHTVPVRVVILGGGPDGVRLLRGLYDEMGSPYRVIGFLDDRTDHDGVFMQGVKVLGPLKHLHTLIQANAVDEVFIALPEASGVRIREYVLACRRRGIPVKVIPGLADALQRTKKPLIEEISVEDLLRRPPINIKLGNMNKIITGKRVLVTGAGGSIGSEICRQVLALEPEMLILFGHGENSIDQIRQSLKDRFPKLADRLQMVIGSVADDLRVKCVFQRYRPDLVFHAAAHKHVPIMEENVPEAVSNNVLGTYFVIKACGECHVERMVLISTDKAVYPSSVMGATKWLGEEAARAMASVFPQTTFVIVRFGNVLGSRGSVVPIFKRQILQGGPVTVTHPEMTRYFMTIPEAVQLVLQAGSIGKSGELYLLDMGEPVRILDLARDMIYLSGLEPDKDIKIVFTGLRPGEKLHEQLTMDGSQMEPAECERMTVLRRSSSFSKETLSDTISHLRWLVMEDNSAGLLSYMGEIIPAFDKREYFTEMASEGILALSAESRSGESLSQRLAGLERPRHVYDLFS